MLLPRPALAPGDPDALMLCSRVQDMFDPCNCYKKRETGLVHPKCLKGLIEKHQVRGHN